jgi:hypothetical protein
MGKVALCTINSQRHDGKRRFASGFYFAGKRNLGIGLTCGAQPYPLRAAGDFFDLQGFAGAPVVCSEAAVKGIYIVDGAAAFLLANVRPHTRPVPNLRGALVDLSEDAPLVPPDAGREHSQLAEMLRMTEPRIEGY